jgi:hypothetical protein
MRTLFSLLLALVVVGLGAWAYRENYATQAAEAQAEALQVEIEAARARLAVLRAEWAYLNRPDRLNDLAEINFDRLGLLPLQPEQFGQIEEITYPVPETVVPLTGVVDVAGHVVDGEQP